MKKGMVYILVAGMLLALLAGCGGELSGSDTPKGGTMYITANAVIAITYDEQGNVLSVTADSENAQEIVDSYQDYAGKSCSQVVSEIVEKVGEAGHLTEDTSIEVTFEEGSGVPEADFVGTLEQQIQDTAQKNGWDGTVQIDPPVVSTVPDSRPDEDPTGPSIPEGAQLQEDGTYVLVEYLDRGEKKVDSENEAYFIDTAVYDAAGRCISQERIIKESGDLRQRLTWEYDEQGNYVSAFCIRYGEVGVIREHYREEYEIGRLIRRNNLDKDGTVSSITEYSYYDNGKLKLEEESSTDGIPLAKKEYTESGVLWVETEYYDDGAQKSELEYDTDGVLCKQTIWFQDGQMQYYEEFYPNGYSKTHKKWTSDGILTREFVSFHGENPQNGILTEYDNNGKMISRTTEGNPDGSAATWELWYEDNAGGYVVNVYDAPYMVELDKYGNPVKEAQVVEVRYTLSDGSYHNHTYDYEKWTMHTVGYWVENNAKRDMITSMDTDEPIEGYYEHTIDGIYHREEWKDGTRILEITDGARVMGYTVKDTVTYYPNGQVKTSERYYYADGGRLYYEYDENGELTYSEETTQYFP